MTKDHKVLNRDQIKYLAIILMTFNHIAHTLMTAGTALYELFEDIGFFTSITMCYFFTEGYFYTSSKKKYAKRLLIFALISEIPYVLAMGYFQLNVMFTFLICFGIYAVPDSKLNNSLKTISVIVLILFSALCDCAFILPIAALLFRFGRGDRKKQAIAWTAVCAMFFALSFMGYAFSDSDTPFSLGYALLHSFYAVIAWIASAIIIMFLYNGKKSEKHLLLNKWSFYIYYPLHLLILWSIKYFIM